MKKFLVLIAILGGVYELNQRGLFSSQPGSFDDVGNPQLQVLTFEACGSPCSKALEDLDKRDVSYRLNVVDPHDKSSEAYQLWQDFGAKNSFPLFAAGNGVLDGYHPPKLAGFLAHRLGDQYLTRNERWLLEDHFYEDGSPMVVMYGASWCGYCKKLGKELDSAGIDWLEIDVEASPDKAFITSALDIGGYPSMYVGYERVDGKMKAIREALDTY